MPEILSTSDTLSFTSDLIQFQSMVVGRIGVAMEIAPVPAGVESRSGQEAVLAPHQRTMVNIVTALFFN